MNQVNKTRSVGINPDAMGRSADCPPSRTKKRRAFLFCSLSAKAVTRRLRPIASEFIPTRFNPTRLLPLLCFLALLPVAAHAKDAAPAPGVTRMQAQAFKLAYALGTADLQAVAYTKSVERLQGVSDPQVAGAEVAHFSSEVSPLRRARAAAYAQASALLAQMGAPLSVRAWAAQSAARLSAPLAYSKDNRQQAKTDPNTAAVSAELEEITALRSLADAQQTPLALWLVLAGGKAVPWTAEVGTYAAELHRASETTSPSPLPGITARVLLRSAPPGAPAVTRESLATLIPSGGGNLQNLATIAPADITSGKIAHVYETLLTLYGAESQAETLDKSAS